MAAGGAAAACTAGFGFLSPGLPEPSVFLVAAFRKGLSERGYVEGKNISVEYRWAKGHYDQLQTLAADLLEQKVAVIAATGGTISARAAKAATSTIPIVFNVGEDPIGSGLVASFNRPGGNATGVNTLSPALEAKRLDLLRELIPRTSLIGLLLNPTNPDSVVQRQEVQAATAAIGRRLAVFEASNKAELEKAFVSLAERGADALIVGNDVFFTNLREYVTQLALQHSIPAVYAFRQFSESGGLMSYSTNLFDVYHQIGIYVGRILGGESPADLPVVQPTKYELVINLKTAKALGLDIPPSLLARADEVIE